MNWKANDFARAKNNQKTDENEHESLKIKVDFEVETLNENKPPILQIMIKRLSGFVILILILSVSIYLHESNIGRKVFDNGNINKTVLNNSTY